MESLTFSDSITVSRTPEDLYSMVSDVTRTGEWSPICTGCWWESTEDGTEPGPAVGKWFGGRNEIPGRTWETRSQVVAAEPGREFAFVVGESYVRWGYTFEPTGEGTTVTESWEFLPGGLAMFAERFGDDAQKQIQDRTDAAHSGIPITLAAIKRIAES